MITELEGALAISPAVSSPRGDDFAVTPVVDYEPPRTSHAPRRHRPGAPRRPYTGQPSRQQKAPTPEPPPAPSAPMRRAAIFADAALRRVLEVIDRRRPVAQLRPMLAPSLVDSVLAIGRCGNSVAGHAAGHPATHHGAAVLRRMRLQPAGHHDPETAAEVFGSYSRGDRIHAIACRVEQVRTGGQTRWLVVALHIG